MSTSNPAPGVGGTAKDGGLSTADTVADGGPDNKQEDPSFGGDDGKKYEGYVFAPTLQYLKRSSALTDNVLQRSAQGQPSAQRRRHSKRRRPEHRRDGGGRWSE